MKTNEGFTMNDEQRIDAMIQALRSMKADLKKLSKLSAMDYRDMTQKQAQKRNADADWICMANIKRKHELHALAVEIGLAERRESYAPIELTDGWHKYKYTPRVPFSK